MRKQYYAAVPLCAIAAVSFSFVKKSKPSVKATASIVFPVTGHKSKVGSFWGEPRDDGERNHKGIDIFAEKGTPVVAVADGEILSKNTTPMGGKVLWLQPRGALWTAYYAHLDKQLVKEGERVRKGQVIGTIGTTGNAHNTSAHLHFGIYTWEGAVNPYPMVKNAPRIASPALSNHAPDLLAGKSHSKEKAREKTKEKKQALANNTSRQKVQKKRAKPTDRSTRYYVINVEGNRYKVYSKKKKGLTDKRRLFVCRIGNKF